MRVEKPRKLSRFLAQEMLYDYVTRHLDEQRNRAVEEFVVESPEIREDLEALKSALNYVTHLSTTQVTEPLLAEIKHHKTKSAMVVERFHWRQWPQSVKWSLEALTISGLVALAAIFLPWEKLQGILPSRQTVTLAKIEPPTEPSTPVTPAVVPPLATSSPPVPPPPAKPQDQAVAAPTGKAPALLPPPTVVAKPGLPVPAVVAKAPPETKPSSSTTPAMKGFVYRAQLDVADLDKVTNAFKQKLAGLGAVKSGQVDLGWRRDSRTTYFHFSLPAENEAQLNQILKDFGPVRMLKEPHWRVMPPGKIRFIIYVRGKSAAATGVSSDPNAAMDNAAPTEPDQEGEAPQDPAE